MTVFIQIIYLLLNTVDVGTRDIKLGSELSERPSLAITNEIV